MSARLRPAEERGVLTPRELAVLQMRFEGKTNRDVAVALVLSEHTIKWHSQQIFFKLNATTMSEAIWKALSQGYLIPPTDRILSPKEKIDVARRLLHEAIEELNL